MDYRVYYNWIPIITMVVSVIVAIIADLRRH